MLRITYNIICICHVTIVPHGPFDLIYLLHLFLHKLCFSINFSLPVIQNCACRHYVGCNVYAPHSVTPLMFKQVQNLHREGFNISQDRDPSIMFNPFDQFVFSFSFLWADESAEEALLGHSVEDL